ncbi:hypothetical protein D9758_003578 [Tetrapyrgos nigripes]|uniref:5-formyltetrahydrofolate cyclo-ligase n=1 Tax=Tetrapyrgos nigripes TaxID=182062 RepID=A0A8H5GV14_9AGAR|nr:hypothetical protein D9758_003578 [Tetrapyrgos nigripes]
MLSVTAATLKSQKKALRKAVSATLRNLEPSSIQEQSSAVTAKILSLLSFRQCKNISCYLSMPSGELDTSEIVRAILRAGKTLYVPKIDVTKDGKMDFWQVYDEEDLESLPGGVWGIREPTAEYKCVTRLNALDSSSGIDMILLPGVAFDRTMSRLGHGKGYYDRYINSYIASGRPRPLLVALALREQLIDPTFITPPELDTSAIVPMAEHDWKMDLIVTPDEVLHVEATK